MVRVNRRIKTGLLLAALTLAGGTVAAEQGDAIIPAADLARAQDLGVHGPTESSGILSAEVLGLMPLGEDFAALEGYVMRARRISVAPGGVVGVHQHQSRPGTLYVLEGQMTEMRSDSPEPIVWQAGAMTFESHGTIHWWRNDGDTVATAFTVDIIPAPQP